MRTRSNYGIIGPQQTISTSTTGGIYTADDQRIIRTSNNWPRFPGTFPTAYKSLINSFSGTKIYVSQVNGDDSYSGLSTVSPFATFDKAMTYRKTLTTVNVMIIVYAGSYTATPYSTANLGVIMSDISSTYSTVVVCMPGETILNWNAGSIRDAGIADFNSSNSALYGAILKRDNNGKTTNYSTAFSHMAQLGPFYNCVLQETNANNNWSLVYNNLGTVTGPMNYCTFAVNKASPGDYASTASQVFNNCLYNYTYTSTGAGTSTQNNPVILSGHDLDFTTYRAGAMAGAGVYYGTYSWSLG